ncbi:valine dehydrogenase [Rhodococcus sp. RS1C4]|nr:Glu/Leu/Phe/Val dehydrogenase dimerization domain-containing protein [Rhodococcus sp. RS1C4]OZC48477.1 valine dehydrogenase [Rhodococcus sp. RS1C4]
MTLSTQSVAGVADTTVFDRTDALEGLPHEQVVFCEDHATGLQSIIAIHSTTLGPALGGTRFYPYSDQGAALTDVLRLSRGMTYKAAIAGVPLGGGKAVIIGDPRDIKTRALLRSYGRFIDTLGGRYISAGDVGTGADDLDVIGERTAHVVGRSAAAGGSGNSGPMTALGVYQSLRAAATSTWGTPDLTNRVIGVEGVGKVGSELIALLVRAGANVIATDVDVEAVRAVAARFPSIVVCDDVLDAELDVYAPCALGATVTVASTDRMTASIVCGAANNQLRTADVGQYLHSKGVLWVPDYVANAGGLIQVAGEKDGVDAQWVRHRVERIYDTVLSILDRSRSDSVPPGEAADRIAGARLRLERNGV